MPIEVAPARLDARPSSPADAGANGRDFLGEDPSLSTATIVPATGFATSFTIDGTIVFQTDTNGEADRDKEDDAFDPARSTLPSEDRRAAVAHETGFELASGRAPRRVRDAGRSYSRPVGRSPSSWQCS